MLPLTSAVGLLLAAASVRAVAAPGIDVALHRGLGAERCPDRDALAARVAKHLAHTPREDRAQVAERVTVSIERSSEGYAATVAALGGEGGTRRFFDKSEDCTGLAEALALALAMIADGTPVAEVEPQRKPAATAASRPWELGAGALGSTGMLGAPSFGVAVQAVWHPWPRLTTSLIGFWLPSRSIAVEQSSIEVTLAAGLANVCLGLMPYGARVYPALCGLLGAGALHGAGENLLEPRSVWRPWLAAGGSLSAGVRIFSHWTLAASAGRLFSLKGESFAVGGRQGQVYDSGSPGWLGQVGLLWRIP
jgi:hypothetical protein